ncbi:kinase-like domain-containing protein [Crucibulum laeve]|uniref:Kinase-like domain-containing protein n=1 Tax=Crucibulum laeve TaxID=68775 RepID=A0A5C3LL69_9AGAR|nr:kinase-like domain-containing protein [Crucibulum laeve]
MSLQWHQRKARLASLLKSHGDEDADALTLDRLLHGQSVIGKTAKTTEIDTLRFQDKDLDVVGTLAYGQFGVVSIYIDVVNCRLNGRVYARKSIEKRFALRARDQCFPQFERDILLQALKTDSKWAPHLLCAFQSPTHLNLVMDYAEGGTLWDVLESSPHDGKILEADLKWWTPQIVNAIHWCHSQGFAHRDIKPHNFVLTPDAHVLLIDFGSAAPLLPPGPDGSQLLPKRYCLVPCGTCDYISPEILKAHEEALVALEMEEEDEAGLSNSRLYQESDGYGMETDWWSLGAMLYEMAYGVAPFFADDIRQTYQRIISHQKSLRFAKDAGVSKEYQDFLRRLLTDAELRIGRRNIMEITDHRIFNGVNWSTLPTQSAPPDLHLPQFTYTDPPANNDAGIAGPEAPYDESISQGFAFSALFQSSKATSPGISMLRPSPSSHVNSTRDDSSASFIGFSWGPTLDAFPHESPSPSQTTPDTLNTPRPIRVASTHLTPGPSFPLPGHATLSTPMVGRHLFSTPNRPYSSFTPYYHGTLPRNSTVRRTAPRRSVSDREAMKQLVDCVGMSARKKVLESGRKPRILTRSTLSRGGTLRRAKELRFDPTATPIPVPDYTATSKQARLAPLRVDTQLQLYSGSEAEGTDSEGPPSPSPTPRPGSAMSILSSRRSGTPTMTGTFSRGSSSATGLLSLPLTARRASFGSAPSGSFLTSRMDDSAESVVLPENDMILDLKQMEDKYMKMMHDIRSIGERLEEVSVLVGR